ncbi:MAG: TrkA family potassium uptake protein [Oscillospiraceae bacterium]|nr:TrkA family potassium uptake protein [Oscillospiraceae bacterium]
MKNNKSDNKKGGKSYIIVVGCGRLGANLATALSDVGENVVLIDKSAESFRKLSPSFGGITLVGDASEMTVLNNAGIAKATAVISLTNNDNTNIMVAQLAKKMFNINQVIARLYDPERECVYREFGIETICPAVLSMKEIDILLPSIPLGYLEQEGGEVNQKIAEK